MTEDYDIVGNMSKKKSKGGRPRIHETGADRSRAYYERKKAKMKELEDKVKKLETKTSGKKMSGKVLKLKEIEKFDWQKITPNEISLMDIQKLEQLTKTFREKLTENPAIKGQLQHLIQSLISSDILDTSAEITVEDILGQLDPILDDVVDTLQESTQQQTLLYLMEAELANRERLLIRDYKLEILQSKVEELKKETKEKELKQKQK